MSFNIKEITWNDVAELVEEEYRPVFNMAMNYSLNCGCDSCRLRVNLVWVSFCAGRLYETNRRGEGKDLDVRKEK